jgi:HEAT repeat protein
LWRKRGSVTDDKLELYAQITLELAQQLDREKEGVEPDRKWLVDDEGGSLKLDLLRHLAFNQLFRGLIRPPYDVGGSANDVDRLVFTSEELRAEAAVFARTLKEREGTKVKPRKLVEDIKATAMLRQVSADHYAFAHLTLQEYLAAWQLAKRDNGDTCERIFCRAYFNPTLAEMEVLPMTLGILRDEVELYYQLFDQLSESLDFKSLRLRARGLYYGVEISRPQLQKLIDWLIEFIQRESEECDPYRDIVAGSFAMAQGNTLKFLVDQIALLLTSDEQGVRMRAASALGRIGSERAVEVLLAAMRDPDSWVRGSVAEALGQIGSERAAETLLVALQDWKTDVPRDAAEALGRIGSERVVEALVALLQDQNSFVRRYAALGLGWTGSEQAERALLIALHDKDHAVRVDATFALGLIGSEQATEVLLSILLDRSSWERADAAKALGFIRSQRVVEALLTALRDRNNLVRMSAAGALGWIGSERAVGELVVALRDRDRGVQQTAAGALGRIGSEKAEEALIAALRHKRSDVRGCAAYGLGWIGSERALKMLLAMRLDQHDFVRKCVEQALARIWSEREVESLLVLLQNQSALARNGAAESLARIGDQILSRGLLKGLTSIEAFVRQRSAGLVGYYVNDEQALKELSQLAANDPDEEVRKVAYESSRKFERKLQYFDIPIRTTTTKLTLRS